MPAGTDVTPAIQSAIDDALPSPDAEAFALALIAIDGTVAATSYEPLAGDPHAIEKFVRTGLATAMKAVTAETASSTLTLSYALLCHDRIAKIYARLIELEQAPVTFLSEAP